MEAYGKGLKRLPKEATSKRGDMSCAKMKKKVGEKERPSILYRPRVDSTLHPMNESK